MYSSYSRAAASAVWIPIVGLILAIVATVLAYIFIMPKSKVKNLNKFLYFLHNVFTFKTLLVEKIFRALYVSTTIYCIISGFLTLFTSFLAGLLTMVLGPVSVRIVFEMIMMFVMLVQNTNAIRNKLCGEEETPAGEPAQKQPPKEYVFCSACGTRYNKLDGRCPGCGQPLQEAPAAPNSFGGQQNQFSAQPVQNAPQGFDRQGGYQQPYAQRPVSSYGQPAQGGEERRSYRRYQTPQG